MNKKAIPKLLIVILISISGIGISEPPNEIPSNQCHEEGKDILCGHYKAAVAGLLTDELISAASQGSEDTDVTHCFLDIELDPNAETINGACTLTITSLLDDLATLTLGLRDNMVVDGVTMSEVPVVYSRPGHTIEITLDQAYDVNESFEVKVAYHGSPDDIGFASFLLVDSF